MCDKDIYVRDIVDQKENRITVELKNKMILSLKSEIEELDRKLQNNDQQRELEYTARVEQLRANEKRLEAEWAFVEKEKAKIARAINEANELVNAKERLSIELDTQINKRRIELYNLEQQINRNHAIIKIKQTIKHTTNQQQKSR
jgi:hypothetical protein